MHFKEYKAILSAKNGMNLYRGCTHGCIYCDSRSHCYQINHDFEDIEIKKDAPLMLEMALKKKRKKCMIGTGAMCDPYLHLESQFQSTHQCLAVIEKYGFGLSILTKSDRILNDLDVLIKINKKAKCIVQMTLTTYDDELCKILEPNVSITSARYNALKIMNQHQIQTIVWLSPILPFINDSEENLRGLLQYCIDAKVYGIICFGFGVTMREGNREYFYDQLDRHFPKMKERYIQTYNTKYVCNSPNHTKLMKIFIEECKKHGIRYQAEELFQYLSEYESKTEMKQMSFW